MSSANSDERDDRLMSDSAESVKRAKGENEESKAAKSKAKKLASGKRADQNRKAQRAFRQRKDQYIKDLELRSQELEVANSLIVQLKEENDRLNDIAKSFHSRVGELEAQIAETEALQKAQEERRAAVSGRYNHNTQAQQDEQAYYSSRGENLRGTSQVKYNAPGHLGAVYSQSQGLL